VSFQVPGLNSADWSALEMLAALMGKGYGSRLGRTLVDTRVAARVEADYFFSTNSGRFVVRVWPSADARGPSFDRAESALFRELDRIRREVPGETELARAKAMVEQGFLDRTGSYVARASLLARFEGSTAGLRGALDYRNFIRSIRAEDVQRSAAKHLTLQTASVIELQPSSEPQRTFDSERFAATVAAWAPGLASSVEQSSVRAAEATETATAQQGTEKSEQQLLTAQSTEPLPVKDFSTLRGPRAFVREDHSSPLITVAVLFHGGRIVEESNNSGITELMLRSMIYGTARRSYLQTTDELEQLGARLEVVVEPDFFGLVCSVLSRNSERIPRILRDIIEEPAFREADLKLASLRQLGAIRSERDSGEARAREMLFASLFAGHPYSLPAHGREEVVAALTTDQLRDWHARSIKRQLPLIAIVGDTEGSALVGGQLAEGFRRNDLDPSLKVRIPGTATAAEKADQVSGTASVMSIGSQIPKADQVDPIPLELLADALNGPGGRLEAELINKQSVSFDASFDYLIMFSAGAVWIEATSPPDKEGQGRTALQAEFQRLARDGLTENEVAGAQASAAGVRLLALQSQRRRAIAYVRNAVYQRAAADVDSYEERVSRFTTDNLKRVLSQYFKTASIGIARGSRN
jgi:zinc protease